MHYVYIIETESGTHYAGVTNDLVRRLQEHVTGGPRAAKYLRANRPLYVVFLREFENRGDALRFERSLKRDQRLKQECIGPRRDILEVIETELSYQ